MALSDDLETDVKTIFQTLWSERDGQKVPETADISLGNHAVKLKGTVLYADLAESTKLVNNETQQFAAEIYKTFLHCASKIIRADGGVITAFDGDRIMAVYIEIDNQSAAARSALKINHAVKKIIRPAIKSAYSTQTYVVNHAVGVDTCDLYIARTGIRGSNDLVWVGRAANYAAKLCSLRSSGASSFITSDVFDLLTYKSKYSENVLMWEKIWWAEKQIYVYKSTYQWKP